jgi:hypothetical protein
MLFLEFLVPTFFGYTTRVKLEFWHIIYSFCSLLVLTQIANHLKLTQELEIRDGNMQDLVGSFTKKLPAALLTI